MGKLRSCLISQTNFFQAVVVIIWCMTFCLLICVTAPFVTENWEKTKANGWSNSQQLWKFLKVILKNDVLFKSKTILQKSFRRCIDSSEKVKKEAYGHLSVFRIQNFKTSFLDAKLWHAMWYSQWSQNTSRKINFLSENSPSINKRHTFNKGTTAIVWATLLLMFQAFDFP